MSVKWLVFAVVMFLDGAVLLAVFVKWRKVRIASRWPAASGRIVSSRSEGRAVKKMSSTFPTITGAEVRNFAAIAYEFRVDGRTHRGHRVGLGEDPGNSAVAERLQRYPRGADVTVYYDPADPRNCVLDRDPPSADFFQTAFVACAGVAVAGLLFALFSDGNLSIVTRSLSAIPDARAPILAGLFAALAVVVGLAASRQRAIGQRWLRTEGRIVASGVDAMKNKFRFYSPRTYFRARIVYSYAVAGVRYESDRVSFGALDFTNQRSWAAHDAARFAVGEAVEVLYDPADPSSAVLEPAGILWPWWLAAAMLFALAAYCAGLI